MVACGKRLYDLDDVDVAYYIVLYTPDPGFIPEASPKGSGLDSFTVGWTKPDEKTKEFVGRYHLSLVEPASGDTQELFVSASDVDYMFTDLKPATEYTFKVNCYCSLCIFLQWMVFTLIALVLNFMGLSSLHVYGHFCCNIS